MKYSVTLEVTPAQLQQIDNLLNGGSQCLNQEAQEKINDANYKGALWKKEADKLTLENKQLKKENTELRESLAESKLKGDSIIQYVSKLKEANDEINKLKKSDGCTKCDELKLERDNVMSNFNLGWKHYSKHMAKLLYNFKKGNIEPLEKEYPSINWNKRYNEFNSNSREANKTLHGEVSYWRGEHDEVVDLLNADIRALKQFAETGDIESFKHHHKEIKNWNFNYANNRELEKTKDKHHNLTVSYSELQQELQVKDNEINRLGDIGMEHYAKYKKKELKKRDLLEDNMSNERIHEVYNQVVIKQLPLEDNNRGLL